MKKHTMRAVMLDLGRQKETLAELYRFFDHAQSYGYNTVLLSLEDRIRTKSYPYPDAAESYSEDEVRQMVTEAKARGLELIPIVSNFAHAERFLAHKELSHMAELRDEDGFYSKEIKVTACPLLPASQAFFDTYMREVAALFPSEYFCAGLDEDYDIGSCELCSAYAKEHGGAGALFLAHVKRTADVVRSFGKKMMMWDDMFGFYPEILPDVPRDIIMLSWNYYYIERFPRASFGNNRQTDVFRRYDALGFQYLAGVWSYFPNNVDSYTRYAEAYNCMGMLNTTWQMSAETLDYIYPHVAYTGKLWSEGAYRDDRIGRMRSVMRELCPEASEEEIITLSEAASKPYLVRAPMYHMHDVIICRNDNLDDEYLSVCYQHERLKCIKTDNALICQLRCRAERARLLYEMKLIAEDLFDMRTGRRRVDTAHARERLLLIKEDFCRQHEAQLRAWEMRRPGISNAPLVKDMDGILADLDLLIERAQAVTFGENARLDLTTLMPDKSVYNRIAVTVVYEDGSEENLPAASYHPLRTANYNIMDKGPYITTVSFLIKKEKAVKECRIEQSGYGGSYICYACVTSDTDCYFPESIIAVSGRVDHAEHLLCNDTMFASLGRHDIIDCFRNREKTKEISSVRIGMKKSIEH